MLSGHPRAGAHATLDSYGFDTLQRTTTPSMVSNGASPTPETPNSVHFATYKRDARHEVLERQLQEARDEVENWKEKSNSLERRLHDSYNETMKERMRYEDLYSAVTQDQQIQPVRRKRGATKSLG